MQIVYDCAMVVLNILLLGTALVLSIPVLVLALQVASAVCFGAQISRRSVDGGYRPRLAVLVPAHNESRNMLPTLIDIRSGLEPGDRMLVVADNCSDDTAAVARAAGAEVIERHDPERRGKGYALDFGLRHLACDAPEVVIVIDADCRLGEHTLARLGVCCTTSGRPAQALIHMRQPEAGTVNQRVAVFAYILKSQVRPLGALALGLPCQLKGTGMALPWPAAAAVDLASGHLVEDIKLGLDLARSGKPPLYCPQSVVESVFPSSADATRTQRLRWEIGSLSVIRDDLPLLLLEAIRRRDIALLALVLDALVPPITLLAGLLLVGILVSGGLALHGASGAAPLLFGLALALLAASVLLAWVRFGRDALPAHDVLHIPGYLIRKCLMYKSIFTGSKTGWTRTDRQ